MDALEFPDQVHFHRIGGEPVGLIGDQTLGRVYGGGLHLGVDVSFQGSPPVVRNSLGIQQLMGLELLLNQPEGRPGQARPDHSHQPHRSVFRGKKQAVCVRGFVLRSEVTITALLEYTGLVYRESSFVSVFILTMQRPVCKEVASDGNI